MTKIKEKLVLALEDEGTAKELEKFGLTKDVIEGFQELDKPATLDEAIKNFNLQSDLDKKVDKALKTREDNLRTKFDFVEKEPKTDPKKDPAKSDDPVTQALLDKLSELEKWKEEQEQEKQKLTVAQKRDAFAKNLKDKGIPAVYVHELDLDQDFDEQFDAVKQKFEEDGGSFKKDPKPGQKLPFPKRGDDNKPSKAEVEEFNKYT